MPDSPLDGLHVLVVEDEFYLADDLATALRQTGAVTLGPVGSIAQAEATLAGERVDAAVLDLNLRGQRTDELAERLLRDGVPCLIVSGYSKEALAGPLQNARHLEKPADSVDIIRALSALVANGQPARGPETPRAT